MDRIEMLIVLKKIRDTEFIPNWKKLGFKSREEAMKIIDKAIGTDR